jgi:hypothetical protein
MRLAQTSGDHPGKVAKPSVEIYHSDSSQDVQRVHLGSLEVLSYENNS